MRLEYGPGPLLFNPRTLKEYLVNGVSPFAAKYLSIVVYTNDT